MASCDIDAVIDSQPWAVERRSDGAVLVRMRSRESSAGQLPDAVFTFRLGDPQYHYWETQLSKAEG